jgi:hypothetical protein
VSAIGAVMKPSSSIVIALDALAQAAREENQVAVGSFATKRKQQAQTDEDVLYPGPILVAECIKLTTKAQSH